jgi:2,4-diaminopentanoate dehydrogenase
MATRIPAEVPARVIVWGTGNVGRLGLHTVIVRPDLELAGVVVSSPAKVGLDAGELAGLPPVGVACTDDVEPLLAGADVCAYFATADVRPREAAEDIARCLRAGLDVVSTSIVPLIYPPAADRSTLALLEDACEQGGSSCFTSGIDPGWANDLLPLVLAGTCERVDSIRMMEVVNYATYDAASVLFDTMGFGRTVDETPLLLLPGVLTHAWGPVVTVVAAGLGVELDAIEEWHERVPAERDIQIDAGTVAEGTAGALRFEVRGMVAGRPRVVLEHVTRLADEQMPDWPQPVGSGCYRVVIEGNPSMTVDVAARGEDGDHNTGNLVTTVGRVLNAVPDVRAAPPGLLSVLDLPLQTGSGTMFG